jgi:hypothetical protein
MRDQKRLMRRGMSSRIKEERGKGWPHHMLYQNGGDDNMI